MHKQFQTTSDAFNFIKRYETENDENFDYCCTCKMCPIDHYSETFSCLCYFKTLPYYKFFLEFMTIDIDTFIPYDRAFLIETHIKAFSSEYQFYYINVLNKEIIETRTIFFKKFHRYKVNLAIEFLKDPSFYRNTIRRLVIQWINQINMYNISTIDTIRIDLYNLFKT